MQEEGASGCFGNLHDNNNNNNNNNNRKLKTLSKDDLLENEVLTGCMTTC